jgi:predicted signal transduction protein with EAL and GGDEF domain
VKGDINLIHQEWPDVSVKAHKEMKRLKTQKQRDHMSETELIFTALADLSTRRIAGERRLRKWHSTRRGPVSENFRSPKDFSNGSRHYRNPELLVLAGSFQRFSAWAF